MVRELLPSHLTPEQRSAIVHRDGPLLIVAGPGAGKTDVIVRRTAYLIREGKVSPKNVLVTTFTNKAADELYDRLWPYLGRDALDVHVSTIHSWCETLLRTFPDAHEWGTHPEVLDARDQFLFVYARLGDLRLNRFPKARLGDFLSDVIGLFSLCTEESVDPTRIAQVAHESGPLLLGLKKPDLESAAEYVAVTEAYGRYLQLLRDESRLDFAMLQRAAFDMVSGDAAVREAVADRYRYILVDEYQDTNRLQVLLLKAIAHPHNDICAVGDDDQSIYRFRGATVSSFLDFGKDFPGAEVVELTRNFRATAPLVAAATTLVAHNAPHRRHKDLRAHREDPQHAPIIVRAETCAEEASRVADLLVEFKQRGAIRSYDDVVVLFRSVKYHAQDYVETFLEQDIPFTVVADGRLFDREDILHLRQLITFCSWRKKWDPRLLVGKLLEIDAATVSAIEQVREDPATWLEDGALEALGVSDPKDRRTLRDLADVRVRTHSGQFISLLDLFYELLRASGYFERCCGALSAGVAGHDGADAALLNLAQFSSLLDSFQRIVRSQNAHRFTEYLYTIPDRSLDSLGPVPEQSAVRLMTVHQAKGLEFPVVVIGSAMNGRFPGRYRPPKYPVPAELRSSGARDDKDEHVRDQRRLFYVAATRAQDLLIIGAAEKVAKRGSGCSVFLEEIGTDVLSPDDLASIQPVAGKAKAKAPVRQRLSYSALHSYLLCPLQFKLLHDCGFAVHQTHLARFGQIVHRVLEIIHRHAQAGEAVSPALALQALSRAWNPPPDWTKEQEEALRSTAQAYVLRYCESHADRFTRVRWVEEPVELPLGEGFLVTGRIDLACQRGDRLEIVDFKVRSRKGLGILQPDVQARTYALACEEARGIPVDSVVIHLLAEGPGTDEDRHVWGSDLRESTQKRLLDAVEGIGAARFEATPGPHCSLCDFRLLCPHSESRRHSPPAAGDEILVGVNS